MHNRILSIFALFLLVIAAGCKQQYEPPAIQVDYRFLVVEGIINTSPDAPTNIVLTRTRKLNDTTTFVPEQGATIYIESSSGGKYALIEGRRSSRSRRAPTRATGVCRPAGRAIPVSPLPACRRP